MEIYLDDKMRDDIKKIIKEKEDELLEDYQILKVKEKENVYLTEVLKDFTEYYDILIDKKKRQYDSLCVLLSYLDDSR